LILTQGRFNHCPSICIHDGEPVIAWYAGDWECRDDQSIFVALPNRRSSIKLENKSGNPIIISHQGTLAVLYGRFRSSSTSMDRWSSCLFRFQRLKIDNGILKKVGKPKTLTSKQGWLARCNPIIVDNEVIVPIYYEGKTKRFSFCAIAKLDIVIPSLNITSIIEQNSPAIQPTIWQENGKFHCLARNFTRKINGTNYAKYAVSNNLIEWSVFKDHQSFFNDNNSISVFSSEKHQYALWNDTISGRRNMTLGIINNNKITLKTSLGSGAYPNGVVHDGKLHIVFQKKDNGHNIEYIVIEEPFNAQYVRKEQ